MSDKGRIYILFLTFTFLFIFTPQVHAVPLWYRNLRITITPQRPASYQGTDAEFQANPTYVQGEQANFNIAFTYEIRLLWGIRFRMPVMLSRNKGFSGHELTEIHKLIEGNKKLLKEKRDEFFNG